MAAAARRPARNPVGTRVDWLAKHYPRTVVGDTLAAWAEAVGADAYVAQFRNISLHLPVAAAFDLLHLVLSWNPDLRTTIYDAYLPWVAKTLNEKHKLILRANREIATASPGVDVLQRLATSRDYGETLANRAAVAAAHHLRVIRGTTPQSAIDGYTELRDAIIPRFGVIGSWAHAERVDLGPLSFEEAWDGAESWLHVEQSGAASIDPHGVVVYAWPDGWTIRELKTKADLVFEGKTMGHCTKHYKPGDARLRLFSLRDPKNVPHVTMEWLTEDLYVNQLRGRGNVLPMSKYLPRMAEFRDQMFPTVAPVPVTVPASDVVRANAKFFDGRYMMPLSGSKYPIEVWKGNVYVGSEDVDEAIEDRREALMDRGLSEEKATAKLDNFWPSSVLSTDIPQPYEWWFARRGPGMALLDNSDELVQAVREAVDDAEGKPIFAAIRKPTGKRVR